MVPSLDLTSCYCKKEDISVRTVRLKSAALRRLGKFHIFLQCHQTTEFLKNCFNCVFSLPFCKNRHTAIIHLVCKFYIIVNIRILISRTHTHLHIEIILTAPVALLMQFILILLKNLTLGASSGYLWPQSIFKLYILFSYGV